MFTTIVAALAGTLLGTFTGLFPGIHVNLAASILVFWGAKWIAPDALALIILTMAITHTFLDNIPAVYLNTPDADHILASQPGQLLLLQGRGHEAVKLLTTGALLATILGTTLTPAFIWLFPLAMHHLQPFLAIILLFALTTFILREKDANTRIWATIVVLASGTLGLLTLRSTLNEPLLPLLSGLFGISALTISFLQHVIIPAQYATDQETTRPTATLTATLLGTLAGGAIALLPGLGPSQAGTLVGRTTGTSALILTGAINTANFVISLSTMHALTKSRNGALEIVLGLIHTLDEHTLLIYTILALLTAGLATIITLSVSKHAARLLCKTNYHTLSITVITLVVALVLWFSGTLGLLVLITGAAIGLIPHLTGCNRSHAMACIIVPVIL